MEALSAGIPVVALNRGGAKEIVENGVTGELFDAPTVEMMADGMRRFLEKEGQYDPATMQKKAQQFSRDIFCGSLQKIIDNNTQCDERDCRTP